MTDSVEGEGSEGGGSSDKDEAGDWEDELKKAWRAAYAQARAANTYARAYDHARVYAHIQAYILLAVKGSGLVALLLSTVILLGGYVQSLVKEDFFCIMAITVIQAAGIFQDWNTNLEYLENFQETFSTLTCNLGWMYLCSNKLKVHFIACISAPVVLSFWVLVFCICLFYFSGPMVCAAISSWRIAKLNHGNNWDGTDSMAAMMATLNIFYSLIIFQGTMFGVMLLPMRIFRATVVSRLQSLVQLSEEWGEDAIDSYLSHISMKSRKDPLSTKGMDLIKYGAELLDSEFHEDYLRGARLLSASVNKGEDVSWLLLPSGHRIQRLIDSLMISSSSLDEASVQFCIDGDSFFIAVNGGLEDKKEIRELAATIVAHVAVHIDDLSKYPGAMQCISSLLQYQEESTQTYRNPNTKRVPDPPLHQRPIGPLTEGEHKKEAFVQIMIEQEKRHLGLMIDQKRMEPREQPRHYRKREGGTSNELVHQGLTILERLASNSDINRRLIYGASGLLPKIMAPIYSSTLIQDVKTKAWADIVTRCLKVLYQLIRAPQGSNEIFSNDVQALSNLKSIVELGNNEADHQELQLVAMEILTELALDLSINLSDETKKVLVTKQLQLFLFANGDDEEQSAAIAGRAMVSLSTNSEGYSALIMTMENDIIGRLTEILDDDEGNITRRRIAAEIMANLCAHGNVDNMKELLPKVLREIMLIKRKSQEREESGGQNNPASGDEENQGNSVSINIEEMHSITTDDDDTDKMEISDQERKEQEAFLSLAQVICDKLSSADLDCAIQIAVQNENSAGSEEQRRETFVDKLNTIIDDNLHATPDSLRIVKLCGQIAKSVMQCKQYVEIFRNKGFKSSLSEASKTMSELESYMRFVGTDFGLKKTVRPLFSEIEESLGQT